ncbi:MAG: SusD/RagB family nutrient-binding outer membrane lipoprotein [Bacteroidales bacterium]|nr:SusD/RagB family nutrient-binding outer membrane lipoprotein [Bacteroidales bacterium]
MKKIFMIWSVAVVFALNLVSCDDYLDINTDPNAPSEDGLNTSLILPSMEMNLASSYGNFLRTIGGYYSEQYSQCFGTSNYLSYAQFEMSATRSSSLGYTQMYQRVVSSGETVKSIAEKNNEWGTFLAATVLKAYACAAMVDCYDSIPYTESIAGVTQPKYDDGRTVYDGVIAEIDAALAKVTPNDDVATNFLFPYQKADKWIRFANALKLKLYSRISNVDNSVAPKIAELINSDLPTADVAIKDCWTPSSGSENPYYAEEFATNFGSTQTNVVANIAIVGTMQQSDYTDPRLKVFFNPNDEGKYIGAVSGTNFASFTNIFGGGSFNRPNVNYDTPLSLISLSEIEFFKAEYYARSGNHAEAKTYYENAIKESFKSAGVSGAEANIAKFPYDQNNWQKSIGISKWLALSGVDNFEAWCEVRRLRYPTFNTKVSGTDICVEATKTYSPEKYVPGTLYTPIMVFAQVGSNSLLERLPHAEASSTRNQNCPKGSKAIYTMPVFWAKK